VLQNFRSVLRQGLDDHALLSAVMLTFAFAVTAGGIDRECLGYQSEALSSLRQSMSSPDRVTSESTIGAILLLAGIEVCINFLLVPENLVGFSNPELTFSWKRPDLECPTKFNFTWGQYSNCLIYVNRKVCI
jgi:hypothetical protein